MGTTPKPLHIQVHPSIVLADPDLWVILEQQGHHIQQLPLEDEPDILLAPYAMRMTGDMLKELPKAFELAVKGARALRYGPTGSGDWKKGKAKGGVQNKGKAKRKNSKVKAQVDDANEPGVTERTGPVEGREEVPVGTTSNTGGDGQDTGGVNNGRKK